MRKLLPDLQTGDFSHISPQLSTALKVMPIDPSTAAPFPNNVIPASRWSAVSARILAYPMFPKPTPTPLIPIAGTYINTVGNTTRADNLAIAPNVFIPAVIVSAITWSGGYVMAGRLLGPWWEQVAAKVGRAESLALLAALIVAGALIGRAVVRKNRQPA